MKNQLKDCHPSNIEELKQDIIKLWVNRMEDCQYLRDLVTSMPRRLQEVIDRVGGIEKCHLYEPYV